MASGMVIGLDVGTTGCKAAVIGPQGTFLASAMREYPVITGAPGKAEQDAEAVFGLCREVIKEAVAKSGVSAIDAIAASVQGDAVIPADEDFVPVHNAILGMDYRPAALMDEVAARFPEGWLYRKTGMPVHPINSALKILWLKCNADMSRTAHYFTYADFVTARLCGECVIDACMASRTMLCELSTGQWNDEILDAFGIPKAALSRIAESGTAAGTLRQAYCEEFGLSTRPLVVTGAHDQPCGALGAGVTREGQAVDSLGTAEVLSTVFASPRLSDELEAGSFPTYRHAWPGLYFTFALNHTSGIILRWFRDNICQSENAEAEALGQSFYQYIERNMKAEPAKVLMLPHFNGRGTPRANVYARGVFAGVDLDTTKEDIFLGMMDSLSYELCINIEYLKASGIAIDSLRCVGGGARSKIWLQSKADILGMTIDVPGTSECGILGAGILAACGAGLHAGPAQAVAAMARLSHSFYPRENMRAAYAEKYTAYRKLYDVMDEVDKLL